MMIPEPCPEGVKVLNALYWAIPTTEERTLLAIYTVERMPLEEAELLSTGCSLMESSGPATGAAA